MMPFYTPSSRDDRTGPHSLFLCLARVDSKHTVFIVLSFTVESSPCTIVVMVIWSKQKCVLAHKLFISTRNLHKKPFAHHGTTSTNTFRIQWVERPVGRLFGRQTISQANMWWHMRMHEWVSEWVCLESASIFSPVQARTAQTHSF